MGRCRCEHTHLELQRRADRDEALAVYEGQADGQAAHRLGGRHVRREAAVQLRRPTGAWRAYGKPTGMHLHMCSTVAFVPYRYRCRMPTEPLAHPSLQRIWLGAESMAAATAATPSWHSVFKCYMEWL